VSTSGNGEHLAASYLLSNNVFFTTRAGDAVATGGGVRYANNLYSGLSPATGDGGARSGAPLFADPSSRASGGPEGPAFDSLVGFQLRAGSPAIGAGTAIADNGGVDFWNTPLYVGAPDVGPFEAPE
jgi:hypothetical protein